MTTSNICVIEYFSAWFLDDEEQAKLAEVIVEYPSTVFVLFSGKGYITPCTTEVLIDLATKLGIKHSFQEGCYDYHRYINTSDPQKPCWKTFDDLEPIDPIAYMEKSLFSSNQTFSFDKELVYEANYDEPCSLDFYSTRPKVRYFNTKGSSTDMLVQSLVKELA